MTREQTKTQSISPPWSPGGSLRAAPPWWGQLVICNPSTLLLLLRAAADSSDPPIALFEVAVNYNSYH
jgi:hypothetical protein